MTDTQSRPTSRDERGWIVLPDPADEALFRSFRDRFCDLPTDQQGAVLSYLIEACLNSTPDESDKDPGPGIHGAIAGILTHLGSSAIMTVADEVVKMWEGQVKLAAMHPVSPLVPVGSVIGEINCTGRELGELIGKLFMMAEGVYLTDRGGEPVEDDGEDGSWVPEFNKEHPDWA